MSLIAATLKRSSIKSFITPIARVSSPNARETSKAVAKPAANCLARNAYPIDSNVYEHLNAAYTALANLELGEGTGNNYAYLVTDDKSKEAVIIDPANPPEYVVGL